MTAPEPGRRLYRLLHERRLVPRDISLWVDAGDPLPDDYAFVEAALGLGPGMVAVRADDRAAVLDCQGYEQTEADRAARDRLVAALGGEG